MEIFRNDTTVMQSVVSDIHTHTHTHTTITHSLFTTPSPSPIYTPNPQESLHVCKLYNRLSTALLKYEALWLGQWRSSLKQTRAGLKATLLVQEEEEKGGGKGGGKPHIRVNAHNRYVISES